MSLNSNGNHKSHVPLTGVRNNTVGTSDSGMDPMDNNPFSILGVSPEASARDIRTAYRKAALRHHPDKQSDPQEKHLAHERFAKISAAYEVLTNESPNTNQADISHAQHQYQQSSPSSRARFHDPFDVFEHVFREDFAHGDGRDPWSLGRNHDPFNQRYHPHHSVFDMSNTFEDSHFHSFGRPFGHRSFFDSSFFGQDAHDDMFSMMREQMKNLDRDTNGNRLDRNGGSNQRLFTSSSTRSVRNANGETVTTTERSQTVNGKKEQVTERIVYGSDGSVKERHVAGNDSLLEGSIGRSDLLSNSHSQQQQQRIPPPSSWWSRKSIQADKDGTSDEGRNSRL